MSRNNRKQNGANPMESRQAVIVPGPPPQRDPPNATGGHLLLFCVAKEPFNRVRAIDQTRRTLNILQCNTEQSITKNVRLIHRLHIEKKLILHAFRGHILIPITDFL